MATKRLKQVFSLFFFLRLLSKVAQNYAKNDKKTLNLHAKI